MTYLHKTIDAITGEETTKPYTKAELDEMAAGDIKAALKQAAQAEAEAAKIAAQLKLAAVGLTTDDLKALGL